MALVPCVRCRQPFYASCHDASCIDAVCPHCEYDGESAAIQAMPVVRLTTARRRAPTATTSQVNSSVPAAMPRQ